MITKTFYGDPALKRLVDDMESTQQANILRRLLPNIPLIGSSLSVFLEHTEMGIVQFGLLIGLLRGAAIGLTIAITLIAFSEAVTAAFDVIREYILVNGTAQIKVHIREAAAARWDEDHRRPEAKKPVKHYLVLYRPRVVNERAPFIHVGNPCLTCLDTLLNRDQQELMKRSAGSLSKTLYAPEWLPEGTQYRLYVNERAVDERAPVPAVVVSGLGGLRAQFIGVAVTDVHGRQQSGFVPAFEYGCYLREVGLESESDEFLKSIGWKW